MSGITPERYTRRPEVVEAVRVTAENLDEVAAWCGGEVSHGRRGPYVSLPLGKVNHGHSPSVPVGDWVRRQPDGSLCGIAREVFPSDKWQPALPSTAQATEYRLSLLPDEVTYRHWEVKVALCHNGLWRARARHSGLLRSDGTWDEVLEPGPRDEAWWAERSWPLDEALRRADAALPHVEILGKTAADVLAELVPEDGGAPA